MRLIDADTLIANKFKNPISYNAFVSLVKRQPTANPVRHGQWIYHAGFTVEGEVYPGRYQCDKCNHWIDAGDDRNYCPNCGAKMDGGADDEND